MRTLYVLSYESADDVFTKAPSVLHEHEERLRIYRDRGSLIMVGFFALTQLDGFMAIFTLREAAEEFATGDPLVLKGVVRSWTIREWHESLAAV